MEPVKSYEPYYQTVMNEPVRPFLTDLQLRLELSKEKCAETPGTVMLGDPCKVCRLFYRKGAICGQPRIYCEFCLEEAEFARSGRELLALLQEAAVLITRTA
jgi:hypothetical protein